jgi:TRAP-type C4-dicarboxylate transport system permease small subunit
VTTATAPSPVVAPSALRRALDATYLATGYLAAVCILLIMVLMIGQSILREFHVRTGAVNDVVSWLCAAAAFFAMAHAFKHGDFVRVTLIFEKVGPTAQRRFELLSLSIATVAVAYLAWWATRFTWDSFVFDETAQGLLPMPMWIPQSTFALGAILLFVAVVDELVIVLRGGRPSYVVAVEQRHAQGDFSSEV